MTYKPWDKDAILLLQKLWQEGLPVSAIQKQLGLLFTRNSIIGKAHRMNLKKRQSPIKPRKEVPVKKYNPRKKEEPEIVPIGVLMVDLKANQCRWPLGELKDPPRFFCGATKRGHVYCEGHKAKAHIPSKRRVDVALNMLYRGYYNKWKERT